MGLCQLGNGIRADKRAVRCRTPCVNDTLGYPLVIEVENLLAQEEVFKQRRPAVTCPQAVLVVADGMAMIVRQGCVRCNLMGLTAFPISDLDGTTGFFMAADPVKGKKCSEWETAERVTRKRRQNMSATAAEAVAA